MAAPKATRRQLGERIDALSTQIEAKRATIISQRSEITKLASELQTLRGLHSDSDEGQYRSMEALERDLQIVENTVGHGMCDVHPNVRADAHRTLAKYYADKEDGSCERGLEHCRVGLSLLCGREKLFPKMAAELHYLTAKISLHEHGPSLAHDVINHANAAQEALSACGDSGLSLPIYLTQGDAYAACRSEPVCRNLVNAFRCYESALTLLHPHLDKAHESARVSCQAMQMIVRFLSHRRRVREGELSFCQQTDFAPCRHDVTFSMKLFGMTASHAIQLSEKVLVEDDAGVGKGNVNSLPNVTQSVLHEYTGRAYLERALLHTKHSTSDLRRAAKRFGQAIRTCRAVDDFCGQRRCMLQLLAEDCTALLDAAARDTREREGQPPVGQLNLLARRLAVFNLRAEII